MKRVAIGCVMALGLVLGGAVSAQAGEINGNGEEIPATKHAHSVCAFSGLDRPDSHPNEAEFPDDFVTDQHVQSYGKWVSHGFKGVVPSPGDACRGNL